LTAATASKGAVEMASPKPATGSMQLALGAPSPLHSLGSSSSSSGGGSLQAAGVGVQEAVAAAVAVADTRRLAAAGATPTAAAAGSGVSVMAAAPAAYKPVAAGAHHQTGGPQHVRLAVARDSPAGAAGAAVAGRDMQAANAAADSTAAAPTASLVPSSPVRILLHSIGSSSSSSGGGLQAEGVGVQEAVRVSMRISSSGELIILDSEGKDDKDDGGGTGVSFQFYGGVCYMDIFAKHQWHCPPGSSRVNLISYDPPGWFASPTPG
jgi:hypothetical protein